MTDIIKTDSIFGLADADREEIESMGTTIIELDRSVNRSYESLNVLGSAIEDLNETLDDYEVKKNFVRNDLKKLIRRL